METSSKITQLDYLLKIRATWSLRVHTAQVSTAKLQCNVPFYQRTCLVSQLKPYQYAGGYHLRGDVQQAETTTTGKTTTELDNNASSKILTTLKLDQTVSTVDNFAILANHFADGHKHNNFTKFNIFVRRTISEIVNCRMQGKKVQWDENCRINVGSE